jgi:hypothetical protein
MRGVQIGFVLVSALALAGCGGKDSNFARGATSDAKVPGYVGIGMSGSAQPASNTMIDTRTGASPLPDYRQTGPSRGVTAPGSWSGNKQ